MAAPADPHEERNLRIRRVRRSERFINNPGFPRGRIDLIEFGTRVGPTGVRVPPLPQHPLPRPLTNTRFRNRAGALRTANHVPNPGGLSLRILLREIADFHCQCFPSRPVGACEQGSGPISTRWRALARASPGLAKSCNSQPSRRGRRARARVRDGRDCLRPARTEVQRESVQRASRAFFFETQHKSGDLARQKVPPPPGASQVAFEQQEMPAISSVFAAISRATPGLR